MSHLVALVYYNGQQIEGIEGTMFEGVRRSMEIKSKITMNSLKERIHSKLKLRRNQVISRVIFRYLMSENPNKFAGVEVLDDEDVTCMIRSFKKQTSMRHLELYVDIDEAGSSSQPTPVVTQLQDSFNNVNLGDDVHDENDYNVDKDAYFEEDENERQEGQIPNGDSSDTEVDGDFDAVIEPLPEAVPLNAQPSTEVTPFWDSNSHYTYIDWEHPDEETAFRGQDMPHSWEIGQELFKGLKFDSKQAVQLALKHYAMKIHQSYRVVESKPTLLSVKCPNVNGDTPCPWKMRASLAKKSNRWAITKWGGPHTCVNQMFSQDHNKCDSEFICSCILGMVKEQPSIAISLIQERISGTFGYTVSYRKAWKAKQKALAKVYGDWDESYDELPRWMDYMLLHAPGSFYSVATESYIINGVVDPRFRTFRRVFWTFRQCCDAFNYCKPVIQIDGTFLYGKYSGTLLIATTQDGDNHILPIAFAIVEGETLGAWKWFLQLIRLHVTGKQGICLISDRHASIKGAVAACPTWQPPYAHHVYCIRHIASNFNHKFKNTALKHELISIGYEPCQYFFERKMAKFREEATPAMVQWLDEIKKEQWSLAHDDGCLRFGHMTTNLSEAINKVFKGARNLPITALVKCTYSRLVTYFIKRGGKARSDVAQGKKYSDKVMEALKKNQLKACRQQVVRYNLGNSRFEVQDPINPVTQRGGHKWKVYLSRGYCECGRFQAYKYPCSHVLACCAAVALDFDQYVHPSLKIESVVEAYSSPWLPIGNDLNMEPRSGPRIVPDPETKRGKGRPKSTRIRNEMDLRETRPSENRCGHCHEIGHNRAGCPTIHARVNELFE